MTAAAIQSASDLGFDIELWWVNDDSTITATIYTNLGQNLHQRLTFDESIELIHRVVSRELTAGVQLFGGARPFTHTCRGGGELTIWTEVSRRLGEAVGE